MTQDRTLTNAETAGEKPIVITLQRCTLVSLVPFVPVFFSEYVSLKVRGCSRSAVVICDLIGKVLSRSIPHR
jgi:hypothetical protein